MAAELCQPSLKSAKVVMVVYEFFETKFPVPEDYSCVPKCGRPVMWFGGLSKQEFG